MKYIIKNCPCYQDNKGMNCISPKGYYFCQYVSDCVLKQVVEKCKGNKLAVDILELLEIEEVDE